MYYITGDALYALKRFTDAYNAYNEGLRINANEPGLAAKLSQAENAIRNSASNSNFTGPVSNYDNLQNTARMVIVGSAFFYLLPLGSFLNRNSYRIFCITALANYLFSIYRVHGMIQFNTNYLQKIAPDPAMM